MLQSASISTIPLSNCRLPRDRLQFDENPAPGMKQSCWYESEHLHTLLDFELLGRNEQLTKT